MHADAEGLLAMGGDLSSERLLLAYKMGIFPWYEDGSEILWWSPDPRLILRPDELKISKSMRNILNRGVFNVTHNRCFDDVIRACKTSYRPDQDGTWITDEVETAFRRLHREGHAHSYEVWLEQTLVGGLYGLRLGRVFFGESMFSLVSNASKVGFIQAVRKMETENVRLIDCQVQTDHLESLGARTITRFRFLQELKSLISLD